VYKPISLNGLRFSDKRGNFIVSEDHFLTFKNIPLLEKFIHDRLQYWKTILEMDNLQVMQDQSETLGEIEVNKIMRLVANGLGYDFALALTKTNKREAVEVRRLTIKICLERKMRVTSISRALGMPHDLIIYHRNKFKDLCESDKKYHDKYIEIEDYVFSTLYGRFIDDGSGEKLTIIKPTS